MSQLTFAEAEYANKKRKTRREVFLERVEALIPWKRLEQKIARYYATTNEAHISLADKLLHGDEKVVSGDAGYQGIDKRVEHNRRKVDWLIAMRPGKRAQLPASSPLHAAEKIKASVWAKVEHPFRYIKQVLGYSKVRYRGLAKNSSRLHLLAGFTNLLIGRKYLSSQEQYAR